MKKSILNIGKLLQKNEQQQINGGFLGSGCRTSCPPWNYNGQNVPCGTSIGGFSSACVPCTDLFGNGFECRIF